MAGMLKHLAASTVNKGQPSSFYANEKTNPVLQALDHDIKLFQAFIKKKNNTNYKPSKDEASSRAADTLFSLWNQYEPKLPRSLYQAKLLEVGDYLTSAGEYTLAQYQCYVRYLKYFGDVNVDEITDIDTFKKVFFAEGFDGETAGFTFRALMGKTICTYQLIRSTDPKLQNLQSFQKCLQLLGFLRLITQIILPKERLCWLVYNGTIHIYSISRHLMSLGHSSKVMSSFTVSVLPNHVLEFVLWACMCMESSVPLLAVKYLTWRATLYTAVCQCYYDCKSGQHAEEFARRALSKVNELSQLEAMSNHTESKDTEQVFRYATVKMAVMVFKRCVFERRKIPKGLLRPKTRTNLKDAASLPWPRTQSEKLLVDMLEGSAAQMLAIQEAMSDSNRRTLISMPPALDHEVEVLDVFAEMFMAAQEIITGGGGAPAVITGKDSKGKGIVAEVTHPKFDDFKTPRMGGVLKKRTLIDLATHAEDGVPLSTVVKVVKHAYNYEQWDMFDNMIEPALAAVREANDPKHGPDEKALELLMAYDKVVPRSKHRKLFQNQDDEDEEATQPPPTAAAREAKKEPEPVRAISNLEDHLMTLTDVLMSIVNGPFTQAEVDMDMMVDATLMLWKRCKEVFSKYQTGSTDNPKYLQRMDNPSKWVYILEGVHKVVGWCNISAVDPALSAEVVLRLALVFEASAALDEKKRTARSQQDTLSRIREFEDEQSVPSTVRVETASPSKRQGSNLSMSTAVSRETSQAGTAAGHAPTPAKTPHDVKTPHEMAKSARVSKMSMASGGALFGQTVREQLLQAREILETGLMYVSTARQAVALTDQKSIADVSWVKDLNSDMFKPQSVEEMEALTFSPPAPPGAGSAEAESVWNTVRDLHLELIYMYHRVCLKLVALGPNPKAEARKLNRAESEMSHADEKLGAFISSFDELLKHCKRNNVSKALLYMQQALTTSVGGTPSTQQQQYLETAMSLIRKAEEEERCMYVINTQCKYTPDTPKVGRVPPPPLLLCRTDGYMTFKPAPFVPQSGEKVAWYRIFARSASGSNVKVRLNDYFLPGTGEEVPSFHCELKVGGLIASEKYMFAVAAYTDDGKLIGDMVGESTKPLLASHPMPLLMTWAYLCQVSYQVGCYGIAREASVILWQHFVAEPPPPQQVTYVTSAQTDFRLTLHRLNQRVVAQASPVLLRMFLASIFIHVDIEVKQGLLFCDKLSDKGPLYQGQIRRLLQCERVLVVMQLSGWLNEPNLALQAVVQCYGLLAPLIHYKIPAAPVIQVLERCCVILQEIPPHLRHKRSQGIADSLHHMTACLTYHMAKVLRMWGQRALASNINQAARDMLALDPDRDRNTALDDSQTNDTTETGSVTLNQLKKKKGKRMSLPSGKEETVTTGNEELKALEAHMLRLSKQAQGEHELSGGEDPSILHAYIAYLPSRVAYKEVVKFKRRARYLEFLVQCAEKALTEGIAPTALEWCQDTEQWLFKRNENLMGTRASIGKQPGAFTIIGDDPKKYQAAMVEYTRERTEQLIDVARLVAGEHIEVKAEAEEDDGSRGDTADTVSSGSGPEHAMSKKEKAKLGAKPMPAKPRKVKYKPIGWTPMMSDTQKQQQEELELKALDLLSIYFVDTYTSKLKRRKMRRIAADELPWRAQLNTIMGLAQFGVFINRLEVNERLTGGSTNYMYRSGFLDQEWFTFETANTLVVGWAGGPERQQTREGLGRTTLAQLKDQVKASGIEIAAAAATGKPPPPLFPVPPEEEDTPRTYRSDADLATHRKDKNAKKKGGKDKAVVEEEPSLMNIDEGVDLLNRTFTYLRRAVVLAHRGQHWTLLQNACRTMWNTAHAALTRAISPDKNGAPFMAVEMVRKIVWYPFYTAADCLLHMMVQMQLEEDKLSKKKYQDSDPDIRTWMGDIRDEKGGAGLKWEEPLDDVSAIDVRWMRRMIMRTIEILYYEHRWERLVDVALRFNALTDDRYSEFVNPLLVQGQRKLTSRIQEAGGRPAPQPHFMHAERELGRKPTSKDYTQLQLKLHFEDDDTHSEIDPGARLDPEGHNAYSGIKSLKLCSVPLDVPQSLSTMRASLSKSQYTSRALQHSRQMLVLYLAGQNQMEEFPSPRSRVTSSKVQFLPNTAAPHPTTPVDKMREEFLCMDDVQTSPLPKGQVTVVMASYDKTIEMLLAQKQKGLAAEAMRELANLHYHTGNIRGAYRWWSESLDTLLGNADTIHTWRRLFEPGADISTVLLEKCGLWGCILGGALCSNIAQYILTSNLGLRADCCFLSAYFFKALFRSSLPHPVSDRDYALYEVGEGCEVTNLVPGIDLLSERFRADGRTLVSALRFVMEELARGRHNLFVLPLLTLYQFLTTFTCRDLQRSVDGRILKVRILTDLGLFREAFITLQRLLYGDRLPHMEDSSFRHVEGKVPNYKFDTSKPILEPNNLKLLESIVDKRLSTSLGALYGPHLTCHLSLAQAHLFIKLAETMPVLPVFQDMKPPGSAVVVQPQSQAPSKAGGPRRMQQQVPVSQPPRPLVDIKKKGSNVDEPQVGESMDAEGESTLTQAMRRFTGAEQKQPSLEVVKGALLATADSLLSMLSELVIENAQYDKGLEKMAPSELELVVQCKLELAGIARQRQHSSMAARIVLAAMKMLQNADLFKEKRAQMQADTRRVAQMRRSQHGISPVKFVEPPVDPSSQYQYQNFQSRSRLDARLWLSCRLALAQSLMGEITGLGQVKGSERKVKQELSGVRQYLAEGVAESEACGDVEMQAEFMIEAVNLNMIEGLPVADTKDLLKDVIELMGQVPNLSTPGQLLRALAWIHMVDLEAAAPATEGMLLLEGSKDKYLKAHGWLLTQVEKLGEKIERRYDGSSEYSTPVSPLENLYLPHLLPLVQVKLRVGHAMARLACSLQRDVILSDAASEWAKPLGVLNTALEMSKVIASRTASVEAEIYLNMGKVQRQLYQLGQCHQRAAGHSLVEAIRTSHSNEHDLGLMRQAYLELAILYLLSSGENIAPLADSSTMESVAGLGGSEDDVTRADDTSSVTSGGRDSRTSSKKKKWKPIRLQDWNEIVRKNKKERAADQQRKHNPADWEQERRAAWVAIRAATATGNAQRSRMLLVGDPQVTTQPISTKSLEHLPDYIALDLIGSYVLGERKKLYKNEIEEELANLTEELEPPPVETYDDELLKVKEAASQISWTHVMGYQAILQRLCSNATLTSTREAERREAEKDGDLGPEFDLGFISHAQFDLAVNNDVVRTTLGAGPWALRLNYVHQFLGKELKNYGDECCGVYPPKQIQLAVPKDAKVAEVELITKSYRGNATVPIDVAPTAQPVPPPSAPGTQENLLKAAAVAKHITQPAENDLCVQWYQPSLEEFATQLKSSESLTEQTSLDKRALMLFSVGNKRLKTSELPQSAMMWVSGSQLLDLHDRLTVLTSRGEISLPQGTDRSRHVEPKMKKRSTRIKALSPKFKKDEPLEALLRQCMDDIVALLRYTPPPEEEITEEEVPAKPLSKKEKRQQEQAEEEADQIPFDVTRTSMYNLEKLFDPNFGHALKEVKILKWATPFFDSQLLN